MFWKALSMSNKQARLWESTRKRGELFFVVVNGCLGFGGFVFLARTGTAVFVSHQQPSASVIVGHAVMWFLAGFAWGVACWHLNEKRYRERMNGES
jgi:hypothetical protein